MYFVAHWWLDGFADTHPVQLPGRVTAAELAFLSGMVYAAPEKFKERVIFGHPPDAWKVKSDVHWAAIAGVRPFHDLEIMCKSACTKISSLINL